MTVKELIARINRIVEDAQDQNGTVVPRTLLILSSFHRRGSMPDTTSVNTQTLNSYATFLSKKLRVGKEKGEVSKPLPAQLFDWQKAIATWAMRKGQAAVFADCGL